MFTFGLITILAVASAICYYRMAELEDRRPLLWTLLSLLVSIGVVFGLGLGWLAIIGGQVILFIVMTGCNYLRGS